MRIAVVALALVGLGCSSSETAQPAAETGTICGRAPTDDGFCASTGIYPVAYACSPISAKCLKSNNGGRVVYCCAAPESCAPSDYTGCYGFTDGGFPVAWECPPGVARDAGAPLVTNVGGAPICQSLDGKGTFCCPASDAGHD